MTALTPMFPDTEDKAYLKLVVIPVLYLALAYVDCVSTFRLHYCCSWILSTKHSFASEVGDTVCARLCLSFDLMVSLWLWDYFPMEDMPLTFLIKTANWTFDINMW
ncbi:hypothetical protein BV22DRAFT_693656 [Leucogyrophana mollusca]|uniref:Uncharacterized protein n=1 Tax=Leucogyrophana mollusca TaxID=85980 RepID=A0ACB8B930_9AGAM|nr:hypothetical protein BV22DRAFT_693656 [Leucogyrophana mollusca]